MYVLKYAWDMDNHANYTEVINEGIVPFWWGYQAGVVWPLNVTTIPPKESKKCKKKMQKGVCRSVFMRKLDFWMSYGSFRKFEGVKQLWLDLFFEMVPLLCWLSPYFGHEIDFYEDFFYVFGRKMAIFMQYFGALIVIFFTLDTIF